MIGVHIVNRFAQVQHSEPEVSSRIPRDLKGYTYFGKSLAFIAGLNRTSSGGAELAADLDMLDPQIKEAEIILTPNPQPVEHLATVERIWGKEIKFSHIPVTRFDLR